MLSLLAVLLLMTGCEGAFDWVYDEPQTILATQGQVYIDASDWSKWYYMDLPSVRDLTEADPDYDVAQSIQEYSIPMTATGEQTTTHPTEQSGQYMYWFDCFGLGVTNNEFRHFTPTATQEEPDSWTFAIHRNNVRTNPLTVNGVWESQLTDIEAVTATLYSTATFTPDEWSENEVWDDQSTMLSCLVPSQGINVNKVLSSWLTMEIPPMPPAFSHNNHVFIISLKDGTFAALQLADYLSPTGTKCCMTIKYKYPL